MGGKATAADKPHMIGNILYEAQHPATKQSQDEASCPSSCKTNIVCIIHHLQCTNV